MERAAAALGHAGASVTFKTYLHFFPDPWDADMARFEANFAAPSAGHALAAGGLGSARGLLTLFDAAGRFRPRRNLRRHRRGLAGHDQPRVSSGRPSPLVMTTFGSGLGGAAGGVGADFSDIIPLSKCLLEHARRDRDERQSKEHETDPSAGRPEVE